MSGSCECVEILVNAQRSLLKDRVVKGNKSALHLAVAKGNLEIVKTLLSLGADITAKTGLNKNVLELCEKDELYNYLKVKYEEHVAFLIANKKHGHSDVPVPAPIVPVDEPSDCVVGVEVPILPPSELAQAGEVKLHSAELINKKKRKVIVANLEFDE